MDRDVKAYLQGKAKVFSLLTVSVGFLALWLSADAALAFMYGRRMPEYKNSSPSSGVKRDARAYGAGLASGVSNTPAKAGAAQLKPLPQVKGNPLGHDSRTPFPEAPPAWSANSPLPPAPGPRMNANNAREAISPTLQPRTPFVAPSHGQSDAFVPAQPQPPAPQQFSPQQLVVQPPAPPAPPQQPQTLQQPPQNQHSNGADRNGIPLRGRKAMTRAIASPASAETGQPSGDGRHYVGPAAVDAVPSATP